MIIGAIPHDKISVSGMSPVINSYHFSFLTWISVRYQFKSRNSSYHNVIAM